MEIEITENKELTGTEGLPDPDTAAYTCWTYGDMEREFAEVYEKLTSAGCESVTAALYALGMTGTVDTAGNFELVRFSEILMARTVYFKYLLANDIPLADKRPAREQFEEYAKLLEIWGDRHYKGLRLSAEDTEKLRTDSYAVLSGLTKRSVEEQENGRPEPTASALTWEQKAVLMQTVMEESERIREKYTVIKVRHDPEEAPATEVDE